MLAHRRFSHWLSCQVPCGLKDISFHQGYKLSVVLLTCILFSRLHLRGTFNIPSSLLVSPPILRIGLSRPSRPLPLVLQSDSGGEFLNVIMHRLTSLLSIKHVFTSGSRPRLNGATERVHRFLNSSIGIYCEQYQSRWEDFLQPAVYAHNTSPISGISNITPFFLVFGRDAPSPETLSLQLPPHPLSADRYAHHLISNMKEAHTQFLRIKSNLRRRQREIYDSFTNLRAPGKILGSHPLELRETPFLNIEIRPFYIENDRWNHWYACEKLRCKAFLIILPLVLQIIKLKMSHMRV